MSTGAVTRPLVPLQADAASPIDDNSSGSSTPTPPPKRIKTRAFARIDSFDVKSSKQLSGFFTWLKSQKSVEKTAAEKALEPLPSDNISMGIVTAFAKVWCALQFLTLWRRALSVTRAPFCWQVIRFESNAKTADDVDWLSALRNHVRCSDKSRCRVTDTNGLCAGQRDSISADVA